MRVKICGITHPDDATHAAGLGADFIGIIFAEKSKRRVSISQANEIVIAAKCMGSCPVGVFAEQSVEEVLFTCQETRISTVQIHRSLSEKELRFLQSNLEVIPVISVMENGDYLSKLPLSKTLLFDCGKGGSGKPFDWKTFSPPKDVFWILAGGLNPNNISKAIELLAPSGVDVASGVEKQNSTRKDPLLVESFIIKAKKESL